MTALRDFTELRKQLREGRVGNGGFDTSVVLAQSMDAALRQVSDESSRSSAAVVALGSYGRGELCIFSDIDIMVLHEGGDTERLAKNVLYPLWDANLKVGHSVRTVRECVAAAKERIDTLTSMLSARLIAGRADLFDQLHTRLAKVAAARPLQHHLTEMEAERRRVNPYPVMAADVKEGRGGLRTFQGFDWERARARFLDKQGQEAPPAEVEAKNVLLEVRNGLHAVAGRAFDVFEFDLREPVARWLGRDVEGISSDLCAALRLGDQLANRRWPQLRSTARSTGLFRNGAVRRGPVAFALHLAAGDTKGGKSQSFSLAGSSDPWNDAEREAFVTLITSGALGHRALELLDEAGWVELQFPEWSHAPAHPQLAPFHEHPLDAHLWRTVAEMRTMVTEPEGLAATVVSELESIDRLYVAGFLHDIGKGLGGDHSELGARAAERFLKRAGYSDETVTLVASAVRHHLLLPRTATRRDIAARDTIEEVAETLGSHELLRLVYLLTIADSKATGRTIWSDWKGALLDQLYIRVAKRLETGVQAVHDIDATVAAVSAEHDAGTVATHLDGLPPEYLEANAAADVSWHLDAISRLADHVLVTVGEAGENVLVVGRDRRGFLLNTCRAFAAHGVAVREARLFTRSDGVVIDTFVVVDDQSGEVIDSERWKRVQDALIAGEEEPDSVLHRVRERSRAYDPKREAPVTVRTRPDLSSVDLVIEVRAPDRVGLLADIVEALFEESLDLRLARIDTRAGEAIDVLHVRGSQASEDDVRDLCERLRIRVTSG